MSERVASARKNAELIGHATTLISLRVRPPDLSESVAIVKQVTKQPSDPGKKLTTIGAALLILPEPVTSAAAIPIIAIGRAMSSNRGASIKEIYEELNRSLKMISSAKI